MKRFVFAALGLVLCAGLVAGGRALAASTCDSTYTFGRQDCYGYFSGVLDKTGNDVVPGGFSSAVNTKSEFINVINSWLYGSSLNNRIAAAFIVDTMLGRPGTDFGTPSAGLTYARDNFDEWSNRVNYYNIDFYVLMSFTSKFLDTYMQTDSSGNSKDVAFYHHDPGAGETFRVMKFYDPVDGSLDYIIKYSCANPLGTLRALRQRPKYNYYVTLGGSSTGADGSSHGSFIQDGDTVTLTATYRNVGTGDGPPPTIKGYNPDTTYFVPGATSSGSYVSCSYPGGSYRAGGVDYTPSRCWQRTDSSGLPGVSGNRSYVYKFTVRNLPPDNASKCFMVTISPDIGKLGLPPEDNYDYGGPVCFTDNNPLRPYLTTGGGDVHAGGGVVVGDDCVLAGSGNVTGQVRGGLGSVAEYVLSAGGVINNFGSGGSAAGTALTFGNLSPLGGYGKICRPDLEASALAYGEGPVVGFDGVIGGKSPGTLMKSIGGTTVTGGQIIDSRVTLFVNGDVYITGDITNTSLSFSRATAPSFGLIATGNIYVDPAVTRLDGYYYAKGGIDTCFNTSSRSVIDIRTPEGSSQCRTALQVNGLMMANSFKFRRTLGDVVAGTQAAESFNFSPLLYIATPPGFGALNVSPLGQGERPPLY